MVLCLYRTEYGSFFEENKNTLPPEVNLFDRYNTFSNNSINEKRGKYMLLLEALPIFLGRKKKLRNVFNGRKFNH